MIYCEVLSDTLLEELKKITKNLGKGARFPAGIRTGFLRNASQTCSL